MNLHFKYRPFVLAHHAMADSNFKVHVKTWKSVAYWSVRTTPSACSESSTSSSSSHNRAHCCTIAKRTHLQDVECW